LEDNLNQFDDDAVAGMVIPSLARRGVLEASGLLEREGKCCLTRYSVGVPLESG
jgi:hypothetical protein